MWKVIKENFGDENSIIIWIRRFYGSQGKMIGNGTTYSLSSGYFFFHIGIHSDNPNLNIKLLTLNCSKTVPCTIIVWKT